MSEVLQAFSYGPGHVPARGSLSPRSWRLQRRAGRRRPSRHEAESVSAAVTGENATCAGHAAGEPVPPGRTA